MHIDLDNSITLVLMASVFGLVLALWLIAVLFWQARRQNRMRQLESRLRQGDITNMPAMDARVLRLWKDGEETTTIVPRLYRRSLSPFAHLRRLLKRAGVEMPVATFVLALLGVMLLLTALAMSVTNSMLSGLVLCLVILVLVRNHLVKHADRRLALFESQLADALDLCARSLRAGHPLIGSFRLVAEEMPVPVSTPFSNICQLQGLGLSMENAITEIASGSDSSDMKLFAMSVVIQLRSGGNLADMMHRLAAVIRDRIRLKKRVRVLTAQAQLSRRILSVLPFVLLGLLTAVNPNYMTPLYHTTQGRIMLALAASSVALGIWVMNRISVVRY